MTPTSDERSEAPNESWTQCPHCGAQVMTWNMWHGSTLWVHDCDGMVPAPKFKFCPNCGRELEGSGSDADGAR